MCETAFLIIAVVSAGSSVCFGKHKELNLWWECMQAFLWLVLGKLATVWKMRTSDKVYLSSSSFFFTDPPSQTPANLRSFPYKYVSTRVQYSKVPRYVYPSVMLVWSLGSQMFLIMFFNQFSLLYFTRIIH